ncbi:MAG: iron chelate uptake ABC transporter family permease subunit [Thermoplasmata archaeon]
MKRRTKVVTEDKEHEEPLALIRRRRAVAMLGLLVFLFCTAIITALMGSLGPIGGDPSSERYISFGEAFDILLGGDNPQSSTIWNVRMPRVIMAGIVGAGLAAAGMAMQAVFRNPMADPFIIGVSSGAAVGAAAVSLIGTAGILAALTQPFFAFICAIITVFIVYRLGTVKGNVQVDTLLLSGVAVAAFLGAMTSFMIFAAGQQFHQLAFWLLGSLGNAGWTQISIMVLPISLGVVIIFLYSRELNVLLLGEETAHNLGGSPEFVKKLMLSVAAVMTSLAVAFTGIIGFVGLMIPHIMRLIVGSDHRILIVASALGGAAFLMWADAIARSFIELLPVGVVTALCGGPFFLYLLRRRKLKGGVT